MGMEAFAGFRLREGTVDRAGALARRGKGGCLLPTGNSSFAMMRLRDACLNEQARAILVAQRQPLISVPTEAAPPVSLAALIGVRIIRLQAGAFLYNGQKFEFKGCGLAETPFTNRHFMELLKLKKEELSKIISRPDDTLAASMRFAAVAAEAKDCPMVMVDEKEAADIAKLLGKRLVTEVEYKRAASYNGKVSLVGGKFDKNVTFDDRGPRSVYANIKDVSQDGVLDLAGNVLQMSFDYKPKRRTFARYQNPYLLGVYRHITSLPGDKVYHGFRLGED
ncbi:SUMF1/EgtB/PvdO family nonheme iron enzyme [Candidatus Saganbacteria bacterium]|nr:SUMF1/EgtB/PvdO family nonheme iron enzyme [Candidatus Saganbacteria bacterium]